MSGALTTGGVGIADRFSREQIDTIKATVAKGATDAQLAMFLSICGNYGLDPFLKEAWCVVSGGSPMIMTSRDGYLKIAQNHPDFVGLQAFVVREGDTFAVNAKDGTVDHSFGSKRGAITGAWAACHRKGRMPSVCYVEFAEYKGGSPVWTKYPSAMIQKVAEVFVLKRQFGISGLVTVEEIGHEPPREVTQEAAPLADLATAGQCEDIGFQMLRTGLDVAAGRALLATRYGKKSRLHLTEVEAEDLLEHLATLPDKGAPRAVVAEVVEGDDWPDAAELRAEGGDA